MQEQEQEQEQELKTDSDEKLFFNLSRLFENERITSRLILLHLIEVESRELYAKRGHSSLFRMLIHEFKLSESAARRRLSAMELIKVVPSVNQDIVSGKVNLTTLSMAQSQIRQAEKITGKRLSAQKKDEIVNSIKNKTQAETEVELFRLLPEVATCPRNHERRISEESIRLSVNMPDRVISKLKRVRELWAHKNPQMDYVEIIERCADEVLKRADPVLRENAKVKGVGLTKSASSRGTFVDGQSQRRMTEQVVKRSATGAVKHDVIKHKRATYFSIETKRQIYSRANSCCEYIDPISRKRCSSRFLLQIDHVQAIWAGGSNEIENLQLLCSTHNRLKYKLETGQTFLSDRMVSYRRSLAV